MREWLNVPLGAWELVRLARRGQGHRARLIVLYLVLLAFVLTPIFWFIHVPPVELFTGSNREIGINERGAFANRFALAYLQATLFAVVAMTPAYASISLAEEKEQGSLQFLLTTLLTDREIVLGKAAARYLQVLAAALAALPIFVSTMSFGGVSGLFVATGSLIVATTAALATAAGILAAVWASDVRGALIRAYALTAVLVVVLPPFGVVLVLEEFTAIAGGAERTVIAATFFMFLQVTATGFILAAAVRQLRGNQPPGSRRKPVYDDRAPTVERLRLYAADRGVGAVAPLDLPDLPPVGDTEPILWKERHVVGRRAWAEATFLSFVVKIGLRLAALVLIYIGAIQAVYSLLVVGGTAAIALYLTPAAAGLAAGIARERRQATLEPLLALPVDRYGILQAKTRAALERGWWLVPLAILAVGAAFGVDRGPFAGVAAALFVGAGVALVTGVGAWLSVRCWTEQQSMRLLVPVVVLAVCLTPAIWFSTAAVAPDRVALGLGAAAAGAAFVGALAWLGAAHDFKHVGLTRG